MYRALLFPEIIKLEGRRMHCTWISTSYLSYSNIIGLQIILAERNGITSFNLITRLNIDIDV